MPGRYVTGQPSRSYPGSGTGAGVSQRLGDDLWLIAHDDRTGRCTVAPRHLGIAVAAGLVADLLLARRIELYRDGTVIPWNPGAPDELTAGLRKVIAGEVARPAGDWLMYFAGRAGDQVARRLAADGFLVQVSRLRRGRYRPADANWAYMAVVRASNASDGYSAVLATLADAAGLGFRLAGPAPAQRLAGLVPPQLQVLAAHVAQTVDARVVLAQRP
jgi:hypothetical protein